jgi:WhiB family redox-sensing transcriptional regulator
MIALMVEIADNLNLTSNEHWQDKALCKGTSGIFYGPEIHEGKVDRIIREAYAKEICGACAVRSQCLDYALINKEQFGIWGGLTPEERGVRTIRIRRAEINNH